MQTKLIAFAKTPGRSPAKTRLAKTKGTEFAEHLYRLSLACVAEVLRETERKLKGTQALWIIAEPEPISLFWSEAAFQLSNVLIQSDGDLGAKLAHAFEGSFSENAILGFLGTDLPQLSTPLIATGLNELKQGADFVMGPSRDGGFYLLLAKKPVPSEVWRSISYSASSTGLELSSHLKKLGKLSLLETLTDIDEERDLKNAEQELIRLEAASQILPTQSHFLRFLQTHLS